MNTPTHKERSPSPSPQIGKSGRVIEKLTLENEKLRRDLNAERSARQQLESELKATKTLIASKATENSNLTSLNESSERIITRRDRTIEELRASLAAESTRREQAETQQQALREQFDQIRSNTSRELAKAKEEADHATTHAALLSQELRKMKDDFELIRRKTEENSRRAARVPQELDRLGAINHQKQSEMWALARTVDAMQSKIGAVDEAMRDVEKKKKEYDDKINEMQDVCDRMRWVMRLRDQNIG